MGIPEDEIGLDEIMRSFTRKERELLAKDIRNRDVMHAKAQPWGPTKKNFLLRNPNVLPPKQRPNWPLHRPVSKALDFFSYLEAEKKAGILKFKIRKIR
jgi:hypothetical protein